jgi:hypothetical protein
MYLGNSDMFAYPLGHRVFIPFPLLPELVHFPRGLSGEIVGEQVPDVGQLLLVERIAEKFQQFQLQGGQFLGLHGEGSLNTAEPLLSRFFLARR